MEQFIPSSRQASILNMVEEFGFVATEAMVSKFEVTPQTIRRDLNDLAQHGLLTRFHGGAGQVRTAENLPYNARLKSGVEAKRSIAQKTAKLIPNGASLFLSTGTTIEAIAEALLAHEKLHICTNNLNVAQIMRRNESFHISVACGEVRHHDGGIIGSAADEYLDKFRTDIGILGISGVDFDGTLLEYESQEVKTAKTILRNSHQTILVADRHKFGRRAMHRIGHIGDLGGVVTDGPLEPHFKTMCSEGDVTLHIAEA